MPSKPAANFVVSQAWANSNPQVITQLQVALAEATQYASTHPDAVRGVLPENLCISPAIANAMKLPVFSSSTDTASIQRLYDAQHKAG